jgi:hypothetical protein
MFVIVHFNDLLSVMNYKSAFQKFQGTCRKTCKRKRVEKCERERALNRGWITHSKFGLALSYLRFTSLLSLLKMFAFAHFTQVFLKTKTTCQNTVLRLLRSYKRIILYESIYSSTRSELKHAHDLAQHPHPTPHTPHPTPHPPYNMYKAFVSPTTACSGQDFSMFALKCAHIWDYYNFAIKTPSHLMLC